MDSIQIVREKKMGAAEAASLIEDGEVIGFSGFTPAGYPKAIPVELAKRAKSLHESGQRFQVSVYTGASVGDELDGELARAKAIKKRLPYQSNQDVRQGINSGEIEFTDLHLSHVAQYLRYGFVDRCSTAIIEAAEVTSDGKIYPTLSGGMSATYASLADRIFIELNRRWADGLCGLHDVYLPGAPPHRNPIPIYHPRDRIGSPYIQVPPDKIAGIVETDLEDSSSPFREPDRGSKAIAEHILDFLMRERKIGRLPNNLPYQSGVGNVANAVLSCLARAPGMDPICMYTEVVQDSIFELIDADRLEVASTSSLTLSPEGQKRLKRELSTLAPYFVIRQQEMSNNPEIIRRLGVISMNTAVEVDIFGHVNSTHVLGSKILNGIGGSGDFCRNAYVSIYMTPSTAKNGTISTIVPMVTHVDHNEHSVQVVVTEQGLADLRGLAPVARAQRIIEKCSHPQFRPLLEEYLDYGLKHAPSKHTPHVLAHAFDFHKRLIETGTMLK